MTDAEATVLAVNATGGGVKPVLDALTRGRWSSPGPRTRARSSGELRLNQRNAPVCEGRSILYFGRVSPERVT